MATESKEDEAFLQVTTPAELKSQTTDRSGFLNQILISLIAITGGISTGLVIGYSSVSLPQLTNNNNGTQIYLNPDQASWFASLTTIASPFGCLLCGPLSDRFGRKISLLLLNIPCLIGWTLLATVHSDSPNAIVQLYWGRIFSGLTAGMASIPATVYLGEIASHTKLRSMLMSWTSISITLGILIVYILGSIFRESYQIIAMICAIVPILSLILTFQFLPESPLWLISKDRPTEAMSSLKTLRGVRKSVEPTQRVQAEFERMLKAHKQKVSGLENGKDVKEKETGWVAWLKSYYESSCNTLKALCRRDALKPLFIMNGLFLFQQTSGYIVITYYSVDLLLKAGVKVDPYLATILLGLVQFGSGVAVSFVLTRCGRRPMNLLGGSGMALCMIGLGLNMQFHWFGSWFPLLALTTLVVFSMIGFRTVPWTILGEIYPLHIKGVAVGITTCNIYVFSFITVKLYPLLNTFFNSTQGIFYLYGVTSTLGTIFVLLFQPETHKKTLEQIQVELHTKKTKKTKKKDLQRDTIP